MSKPKCYISGMITNLPEPVYKTLFTHAKQEVMKMGFEPVCPIDLPHNHGREWKDYMRKDINALLQCSHMYLLNNWTGSKGSRLELHIAIEMEMKIIQQP